MKIFSCPATVLLVALISTARADLTIVQEVASAGPAAEVTMKLKGDKARIEATPEVTTIFDGATGEILTLLHAQKLVMRSSTVKPKAAKAVEGEKPETGEAAKTKIAVTPTGKKETISGYDAEEYTVETSAYTASYWIAKSYPQSDIIMKQLQAMNPIAFSVSSIGMPDFRDFPGLPIRTNVAMGDMKVVSTLKAVKTDELPASEFEVPHGYQEKKLPPMGRLLNKKIPRPDAGKPPVSPTP